MFHHTSVARQKPPKPHLRLHVKREPIAGILKAHMEFSGREAVALSWRVSCASIGRAQASDVLSDSPWGTSWWPSSKSVLDATYYQFPGEWPAGRP